MGSAERVELPGGDIEIQRRIGGEVVAIHPVDASGNILDTKRRFQMQALRHRTVREREIGSVQHRLGHAAGQTAEACLAQQFGPLRAGEGSSPRRLAQHRQQGVFHRRHHRRRSLGWGGRHRSGHGPFTLPVPQPVPQPVLQPGG